MIFRYSSIDTAYQCLEKFNLQYKQGIKVDSKSADMAFGTVLHASLYGLLQTDDTFGEIKHEEVFTEHWKQYIAKDLDYTRLGWSQLQQVGIEFLRKFKKQHQVNYKPAHLEQKMQFKVGNFDFEGTADFIGLYKGIPSIVDFKTAAYPYDKLKLEISEQMYVYAHAAKQVLNYDVKQIVYQVFVKNDDARIQTIVLALTDDKLKSMLSNVERMALLLTELKEYPKNRKGCMIGTKRCEYYERCYK